MSIENFWSVEEHVDKLQELFYPHISYKASHSFTFVDSCINEDNETVIACMLTKDNALVYIFSFLTRSMINKEVHNVSQLCI